MTKSDKPEEAGLKVHIDTSLQIEQQKVPAQADRVRAVLRAYAIRSTSSYARKEYKRAWLQDLALVYSVSKDCKNIVDVYSNIRESTWHPQAQRRASRCFDAIRASLQQRGRLTLTAAVTRLRAHIGEAIMGAYEAWDRGVSHECRGTGCVRALEPPVQAANGAIDVKVPKCKRSKIRCTVHDFFRKNVDHFSRIEQAIEAAGDGVSGELQRTMVTIRAAKRDPEHLCDSKNCTSMSDALIAVDGMHADHFAANNDKEWTLLARALDKPLINPVPKRPASSPPVPEQPGLPTAD